MRQLLQRRPLCAIEAKVSRRTRPGDATALRQRAEENSTCHELAMGPEEGAGYSSLNSEAPSMANSIYDLLAHHQVTGEWRHRELAAELHRWAVIFNRELGLAVSQVSLFVDRLSGRRFLEH